MFQDILERKKALLEYKSNNLKHSKIGFFWRIAKFSIFFILSNIRQQNVFQDIVERKKASLDYKINKLKKSKKGIFWKGLVHGFGQKLAIFPFFYFRQNTRWKCVSTYSRKKKAFLGYKNNKLEKSKNRDFSKVHGFGLKLAIFSFFSFRQNTPGKCVSRYSREKESLSRV